MSADEGAFEDDEPPRAAFLPVLAVVVLALVLVGTIIWAPTGPVTVVTGRVVQTGLLSGSNVAHPYLIVDLPDRRVWVNSYVTLRCAGGEVIPIRRQPHLWGSSFAIGATRCRPPG